VPKTADQPAAGAGVQSVNTIMAQMIQVSASAQKADSTEKAGHIIVNRIHSLVKTERAVIVYLHRKKRVLCISGDLEPNQDNPFSQAVHEIRKYCRVHDPNEENAARVLNHDALPEDYPASNARKVFDAMGGTTILWLPLEQVGGVNSGYALWLERWNKGIWSEEEIRLISHATVFFGNALAVPRNKKGRHQKAFRLFSLAAILFLVLMALPVSSWTNAPLQVVPDHPYHVFAPFDGIVEELTVQPGEFVKQGDLIFRYDTRVLEKQLEEAQRGGLAVARAELARLEGAAYEDEDARARIPVQKLEVERKAAEVAFLEKRLALSEVKTDSDGIVILDDPDALIGAFLQTGQLVLQIANPSRTKVKIMVPVTDAGIVRENAKAAVRLDSDPLKAHTAVVERIGFDVRASDERIPSILVEGVWKNETRVTPGQRGVAKILGRRIPLGLQLFRKPLIAVRALIGI